MVPIYNDVPLCCIEVLLPEVRPCHGIYFYSTTLTMSPHDNIAIAFSNRRMGLKNIRTATTEQRTLVEHLIGKTEVPQLAGHITSCLNSRSRDHILKFKIMAKRLSFDEFRDLLQRAISQNYWRGRADSSKTRGNMTCSNMRSKAILGSIESKIINLFRHVVFHNRREERTSTRILKVKEKST